MTTEEALNLRGGPAGINEWNTRREKGEGIPSLREADLHKADLTEANLSEADLTEANLTAANLAAANLTEASLTGANLTEANLTGALLYFAVLWDTALDHTRLNHATMLDTVIASDLSTAQGLDEVTHLGPSQITIDSLLSFEDDLPEKFLRGVGLDNDTIAYFRSRIGKPIRFYTCFISYSSADEAFASRLHNDFQAAGIRCWKWDIDARTGRPLWGEIDQAIRRYDKLVLIASQSSLTSPPVIREIERALQQEDDRLKRKLAGQDIDPDVLFPVRIDDYILETWQHERKPDVVSKVIADAVAWDTDNAKYQAVLNKLITDLKPT